MSQTPQKDGNARSRIVTGIGKISLKITRSTAGTNKMCPFQGLGLALQFNHRSIPQVSPTGAAQLCSGEDSDKGHSSFQSTGAGVESPSIGALFVSVVVHL